MMANLKNSWATIVLAIVVILSLVLSGFVWINPYRSESRFLGDSSTSSNRQVTTQSMRDIYLPTTVIHTNADQNQHLLFGQPQNTVLTARQSIEGWKCGHLTRVSSGKATNYLNYLRTNNSLMLTYPSSVPLTIFNDSFNQNLDYKTLTKINHIVIPIVSDNQINHIYLLNDDGYQVFRVRVSNANIKKIRESLSGGSKISVDHKIYHGHPLMTYPHGVKLPSFSYQISKLNPDSVSQTLMNSSKNSSITSHRENNHILYESGTTKQLDYDTQRGTLDYENYVGHSDDLNYQQIYGHIYNLLASTSIPLDSLRFDSYSKKNAAITYRSYVEGFPIFNENGYGQVQIQNNKDGAERYHFSLYSLQVPLPNSSKKTTLPSSAVVFNGLKNTNKNKIEGMRIGYQWKNDAKDKTVTLVPTYYIKQHGTWIDYENLISTN